LETAWKKDAMISVDVSCDVSDMFNGKQMKYSLTVRTPFKVLRTMTLNVSQVDLRIDWFHQRSDNIE
jgi:hypothetical protein